MGTNLKCLHSCRRRAAGTVSLLSLVAVISACQSTELADLPAIEKTKRVAELRKIASDCLERAKFSDDSPDGVDVGALECYFKSHRETTQLYPSASDCPSCYARAGEGAAMLGMYYYNLARTQERFADRSTDEAERQRVLLEIPENEARAKEYFEESMQLFNAHMSSRGPIDVRVYRRAYYVAIRLEQYKRALRYLDVWERNTRLSPREKETVDQYRAWAERQYENQLAREAASELRGDE